MDATPPLDSAQLAQALRQLATTIRKEANGAPLFVQQRGGARTGALLLKRTYKVERGKCTLAPPEDQAPVCGEDVPWFPAELPRVSPLIAVDERFAFRPMTDVIVQARAYAYAKDTRQTTAGVRFGKVLREIVVYGDRRGEITAAGRPRFSEPEPFAAMPVRWDRAYGGHDAVAAKRGGNAFFDRMKKARPDLSLDETPYHYPRNPCGVGFVCQLDEESFAGLPIPNLEHPFAKLTPERLAVGEPGRWMRGPLPAAWDFQPPTWFPRVGYLGMTPPHLDPDLVPEEVRRGLVAEDLHRTVPIPHVTSEEEVRVEFSQAAAPGMSFPTIAADERFELTHLHRRKPVHTIDLPGEVPEVRIELSPGQLEEAVPHLDHVVLRVDLDEVELLWSARFPLPAAMAEEDLLEARRLVRWNRPKET